MATDNPTGGCSDDSVSEDTRKESAVLAFLIDEFPSTLTIPELSLALGVGPDDFGGSDALERAIRELVGAGLLHGQGGFLVPTRTALYFASLEMA